SPATPFEGFIDLPALSAAEGSASRRNLSFFLLTQRQKDAMLVSYQLGLGKLIDCKLLIITV
ncbi:MAG: hypothetical protein WAK60_03010, partial [Sedimentisphaerales bacterium]